MKIDIRRITGGEDELILRYKEVTPDIKRILDVINGGNNRLIGRKDEERVVIDTEDVLYFETVDDKTFAYTVGEVLKVDSSLQGVLETLDDIRFFRCSKSMIININKVRVLKSLSSNRIDATLENGEHILISRTYASDFRKLLKGGVSHGR
ncbi:MAG: LytTR family transcriptional regulator DNA-binding domain-containing protein [Lachnospiraceae bacterium]|nr:LytTR family transcriptional regulator DNA-binding domain-containing protein [Lachnospiraceae bacterium]